MPPIVYMNAWLETRDGERFKLEGHCTIGRFPGNSIVLSGTQVSRWHGLVHSADGSEHWLVDFGSKNGIYLNGKRLVEPRALCHSDEIIIGNERLRFRLKTPVANSSRPKPYEQTERAADAFIPRSHGAVMLSRDGKSVECVSAQVHQWFEQYCDVKLAEGELPPAVWNWILESIRSNASGASGSSRELYFRRGDQRLAIRWAAREQLVLVVEEQAVFSIACLKTLGLTEKESEVLRWMAEGKTTPDVATILNSSPRTVEKHIEHIFSKLGVETRSAAIVRALEVLKRSC